MLSTLKNSVNDAMPTVRERSEAAQAPADIMTNYRKRVRLQNIAVVTGYIVGVALGVAGTVYTIRDASKPMEFEDEN